MTKFNEKTAQQRLDAESAKYGPQGPASWQGHLFHLVKGSEANLHKATQFADIIGKIAGIDLNERIPSRPDIPTQAEFLDAEKQAIDLIKARFPEIDFATGEKVPSSGSTFHLGEELVPSHPSHGPFIPEAKSREVLRSEATKTTIACEDLTAKADDFREAWIRDYGQYVDVRVLIAAALECGIHLGQKYSKVAHSCGTDDAERQEAIRNLIDRG